MSDNDLRYFLFKFLSYNVSSASNAPSPHYYPENFWLDFCRDESLTLTEQKVRNFVENYNKAIDIYLTELNKSITAIQRFTEIYLNANSQPYIISAFSAINVSISISGVSNPIILTMPNNRTRTLNAEYAIAICCPSQEYTYANLFYNGFTMETMQYQNINNLKMRCGENSWWEYDSIKNQITIDGDNETKGTKGAFTIMKKNGNTNYTPYEEIMNNNCKTIIFTNEIHNLKSGATLFGGETTNGTSCTINKIVFEHSNEDGLLLSSGWILAPKSAPSTKPTFDIYTDNDMVKNYGYSSNITVNLHPLSEWSD